jgi:hypothetical protein
MGDKRPCSVSLWDYTDGQEYSKSLFKFNLEIKGEALGVGIPRGMVRLYGHRGAQILQVPLDFFFFCLLLNLLKIIEVA